MPKIPIRQVQFRLATMLCVCAFLLASAHPAAAQEPPSLERCKEFAYSTEEDFVTQGPKPADGNVIISDGDLLARDHIVCARNRDLLRKWEIPQDLGLDAADVLIDVQLEETETDKNIVVFSTELDDPEGRFGAGDLLATNGVIIPNQALLTLFQVGHDVGLDAVHFVGEPKDIALFLEVARNVDPQSWLEGRHLPSWMQRYEVDLWFSVEGTVRRASTVPIYDGDLLSVVGGIVVLSQQALMEASVPAGIPNKGVDFGLDAASGSRLVDRPSVRFSSEILYRGESAYNDGDILRVGSGIEIPHKDIINIWEPHADFLGVDALYMNVVKSAQEPTDPNGTGSERPTAGQETFLPVIQKNAGN